jgi:hypothetical protein
MCAALKASTGPHQDISHRAGTPQSRIGKPTPFVVRWSIIGDDDQQVEITIWPIVTACLRAKEIDAIGLVGFH